MSTRPGPVQLATHPGTHSHLGPVLCPGRDGWGKGLEEGWAGQEAAGGKQQTRKQSPGSRQ